MKLSKDTKILRDLVTELEKGRIPADLAPVKALVTRTGQPFVAHAADAYLATCKRIDRKCYLAGEAVVGTPEARKLKRDYQKLIEARNRVDSQVRDQKHLRLRMLYASAVDGTLSKKQYDLALKDLCK